MIRNLAVRFDGDLLTCEEHAFRDTESLFTSAAAHQAQQIRRLPASHVTGGYRRDVADKVFATMAGVLLACEDVAARLVEESVTRAHESIVAELTVCEQTLPGRYQGTVDAITADFDPVIAAQQGVFLAFQADVTNTFRRRLSTTFTGCESQDSFVARLFSTDPVRERGHAGRGIWWQACSGVKAGLRDISINASTTVRSVAIDAFNTVGARRG